MAFFQYERYLNKSYFCHLYSLIHGLCDLFCFCLTEVLSQNSFVFDIKKKTQSVSSKSSQTVERPPICLASFFGVLNFSWHWSHLYGFKCVSMWRFSDDRHRKRAVHVTHWNRSSPFFMLHRPEVDRSRRVPIIK